MNYDAIPTEQATTETPTGHFFDVPFEQYAAIPAANKSLLSTMVNGTPADAKVFMDGGGEMSEALIFGIGAHCLMLEPEKFAAEYAIAPEPEVDLRTKAGALTWQVFQDNNPGKTCVRAKNGAAMLGMRKALFEHPLASAIMRAEGKNEVTLRWTDAVTGVPCKGRADKLTSGNAIADALPATYCTSVIMNFMPMFRAMGDRPIIIDYKTSQRADNDAWGFRKAYGAFKYYLQEAFYRDGVEAVFGDAPAAFIFIAQEKVEPYKVGVFTFDQEYVERGRRKYRELLERYKLCKERNEWPAFYQSNTPEFPSLYIAGLNADQSVPEFAMAGCD